MKIYAGYFIPMVTVLGLSMKLFGSENVIIGFTINRC